MRLFGGAGEKLVGKGLWVLKRRKDEKEQRRGKRDEKEQGRGWGPKGGRGMKTSREGAVGRKGVKG